MCFAWLFFFNKHIPLSLEIERRFSKVLTPRKVVTVTSRNVGILLVVSMFCFCFVFVFFSNFWHLSICCGAVKVFLKTSCTQRVRSLKKKKKRILQTFPSHLLTVDYFWKISKGMFDCFLFVCWCQVAPWWRLGTWVIPVQHSSPCAPRKRRWLSLKSGRHFVRRTTRSGWVWSVIRRRINWTKAGFFMLPEKSYDIRSWFLSNQALLS